MEKADVIIDYTNALSDTLGDARCVSLSDLDGLKEEAGRVHRELAENRESGKLAFLDLPYQDIENVIQLAQRKRAQMDNLVVLGIGGSALGARALHSALLHPFNHLLDRESRRGFPRMFVADNIDPDHFMGLLSALDLSRTFFIVISKSGGTAETMSQFMIVRGALIREFGMEGYRERMAAITDAEEGHLREIVGRDGLEWLPVPPGVGGRYSVFSPVGLLPAAICGIDIKGLLQGAARMDKRCQKPGIHENPAYLLGAVYYLSDTMYKRNIVVMMPYASGLLDLAEWFQQLWAESLGKAATVQGSPANTGSTPVRALGVTDQHSQVQLYMEGPHDKVITFIGVESFSGQGPIPGDLDEVEGVGYLGGHTLAELLRAERSATETALAKAQRPSLTIKMPRVAASCMGEVMYMLEMATVFAGALYKVDPLDQPGVELGKRYAFAMMGRKGFEKEGEELKGLQEQKKSRQA